jgi:hypothetical protein
MKLKKNGVSGMCNSLTGDFMGNGRNTPALKNDSCPMIIEH